MKKTIKGIITVILLLIVSILTYFVVANVVATKNNTISSFFGYSISYVPTESMEPTISKGSTIMFKKCDIKDANAGDIIVYKNTEHNIYVIHRIYQEVEDNKFIMKGDNNLTYDTYSNGDTYYVTSDNYIGKYVKTVSAFSINSTLSRSVIFVLALLTTAFIFLSEGLTIFKTIKSNKNENRQELNDKEKEELKKELLEELKKEMADKDEDK